MATITATREEIHKIMAEWNGVMSVAPPPPKRLIPPEIEALHHKPLHEMTKEELTTLLIFVLRREACAMIDHQKQYQVPSRQVEPNQTGRITRRS